MSGAVEVVVLTQVVDVQTPEQSFDLIDQRIEIDPTTLETIIHHITTDVVVSPAAPAVSVTNAGPQGPPGFLGATPAQSAFREASYMPNRELTYSSGLPIQIEYRDGSDVLRYVSSITYTNGLPTLIELVRQEDSQVSQKIVTYTAGVPTQIVWVSL
jgi:hypothetical protein